MGDKREQKEWFSYEVDRNALETAIAMLQTKLESTKEAAINQVFKGDGTYYRILKKGKITVKVHNEARRKLIDLGIDVEFITK